MYQRIRQGDNERCTCAPCISYIQYRERVYSPEFRALLLQLGVDWRRDSEVHYIGKASAGPELYGGCFHFVGNIRQAGDRIRLSAGLTIDFSKSLNDLPPEFGDRPAVQLNCEVAVAAPDSL